MEVYIWVLLVLLDIGVIIFLYIGHKYWSQEIEIIESGQKSFFVSERTITIIKRTLILNKISFAISCIFLCYVTYGLYDVITKM